MSKKKLVYAIDFGTSNSLLGAADSENVLPLAKLEPEGQDPTLLRSVLFFPHRNEVFYGVRAIQEFVQHDMQGRLVRSIKKYLPIRSFIGTYVDDRPLNLEDIIALFLREMRNRANQQYDADVDSVVLGRPAMFSSDEEDDRFAQYRLERAAREAGFKYIDFFPEPVAAAFGFRATLTEPKIILVVDLGGGTSDFTVMRIDQGNYKQSNVLSIGGVSIAGDILDGAIMRNRIMRNFGSEVTYQVPFGSNVLKMPVGLMEKLCSPPDISLLRKRDTLEFFRNLRNWSVGPEDSEKINNLFCLLENQLGFPVFEEIEQTKRRLSDQAKTTFQFDYPGLRIREPLSRSSFEAFTREKVETIFATLDDTVRQAGLRFDDIDLVCCTGGTAKVPVFQRHLETRFGPEKIRHHNFYHCVVEGLRERARELAAESG